MSTWKGSTGRSASFGVVLAGLLLAVAGDAGAQVRPRRANVDLGPLVRADERLRPRPELELREPRALMAARGRDAWDAFASRAGGRWQAHVERGTGHVNVAEGSGLAWLPGHGNQLRNADVAAWLHGRRSPDTDAVEAIARDFASSVQPLLGTEGRTLRRNAASGPLSDYFWNIDFVVYTREGLKIVGAHVFFRVNNGNLVQWGAEGVPPVDVELPAARWTRARAFSRFAEYVGGLQPGRDFVYDRGSEVVIPVRSGETVALLRVWQFGFVRKGGVETWMGRVDAETGDVVEFRDVNQYASQVTGGAWPVSWRVDGVQQPMTTYGWPFAKLSPSSTTTNSSGIYTWNNVAQTTTLTSGNPYVNITDTCGTSSKTTDASGNVAWGALGTGGPFDCTVVGGSGGAGNTASAHQQYYHVNKIMEKGRTYLPSNTWLQGTIPVNVNINNTCNAFWNGSSLNFYRSGGGCNNTGEDAGVSMHEWGHGMDSNDGNGSSTDNGTGETYGDFSAALQTRDSCIGQGFLGSGVCGGYGNACTVCDGVRDIDWGRHTTKQPWTVNNFTRTSCPASTSYVGPCGSKEGHCESYVSSGALYDFAAYDLTAGCSSRNATYPDYNCPGGGGPYSAAQAWQVVDRLWYLSRSTATKAFTCTTGATYTSNGCNAGSNWKTMRAVDDDDGDLTNGTPHSCELYAAFNRAGIACTTDTGASTCFRGCTQPATPTLDPPVASSYQVGLSWASTSPNVVDVYRNEIGCNAGFTKIASGLSGTTYSDTGVANGTTYYYQIVTHPSGNESCSSATSSCVSVTPACTPPAAVTGVSAVAAGTNQITVSWTTNGSVSYDVLRSTVPGGPYTVITTTAGGSHTDTTVTGGVAYYYVVRANGSGSSCSSANSSEVSAVTTGDCQQAPTFGGVGSVTALGNGQGCGLRLDWSAGSSGCGAANLVYNVYRSTTASFVPASGNLLKSCVTGTAYDDTTATTGTAYYYKVRAEDPAAPGSGLCGGGKEETNVVERSGLVGSGSALALQNFDATTAAGVPAGWTRGNFSGTVGWYGAQACSPNSSSPNILRFGNSGTGAACSANYALDTDAVVYTSAAIPAGAGNVTWSFTHRFAFETNWDGGRLVVSANGSTFYRILSNTYLTGQQYTGAINDDGSVTSFTGTNNTAMLSTSVNLSQFCTDNTASGFNVNCSGQTIYIGFESYSDPAVTDDGWFVDNVQVSYGTACSGAAPLPVAFLTATGKDSQVTAQWLNPTPYAGPTRVCSSTSAIPANPSAAACPAPVNAAGSAGAAGSTTFTGLANGSPDYLAAFVNDGSGVFSARRSAVGHPMATSGNAKWNFSTAAAALAPPHQSSGIGVFAGSNDRTLYAMTSGAAGGNWPASWKPASMNGPAQAQPMTLPASYMPFGQDAVFVSSQDGYVYCFNASTGAGCPGWPAGGRSATNMGLVQATPTLYNDPTPANRFVVVGTRVSGSANSLSAVKVSDGTTPASWPFTNSVAQGSLDGGKAIGIISGAALVDAAAHRAYFGSRVTTGGSAYTIWAVDFSSGAPVVAWARGPAVGAEAAIGDVDGIMARDSATNRLLVGTVNGEVVALDMATGATAWRRSFADGPVKGFVYYSAANQRAYFSTTTKVWSIPANGSTGSDWSVSAVSPTRPLLYFGTTKTYVGACADGACTNGRLIELDSTNNWATPKTFDIAGAGGLGDVIIDRGQSPALAHMGSRSGRVFAIQVPLP